ncbi:hypothetical protein EHS39_36350 [Ensifer sp. MPMI2T]|nr:hypothetical protein EHS39_36350 [Ensifer sp. MPMI2T]
MKTPWKFLAQLTSRRSSAKAQESSMGNDTYPKALESDEEHRPALRLSLKVAASPPAHDVDVSIDKGPGASHRAEGDNDVAQALKPTIEEPQTTARHEADHSGAEANLAVRKSAASTKSQSKPRSKHRRKRADAHVSAQSAAASTHHQRLQPSSSRDLFFREASTLDEDIKMLRIQLAQKLQLQNGQLKKMLERFDVS